MYGCFNPKALHHTAVKVDLFMSPYSYSFYSRENRLIFGRGLLGTLVLRYLFSAVTAWAWSWLRSYGDHHWKQGRILNPIFFTTHMRKMSMYNLYFQTSLLIDTLVPIPAILWHLLQGSSFAALFVLQFCSKLWNALPHRAKDEPQEACRFFSGRVSQHWKFYTAWSSSK